MRMRLWVLPVIALLCAGCLGEEGVMVTETERTPDMTYEAVGMVARFYDSGNPYTKEVIGRMTGDPRVQTELNRFGGMGYALSPENSFVTEADTEDGQHLEMTVLSMGRTSADERDAVYLFCVGGRRLEILPVELRLEEPEDPVQFTVTGDGVWLRPIEPVVASIGSREDPQQNWNWRRWAKCVSTNIVASTTTCILACRFAPVVYVKCAVVCSGIRATVSIFECSIQEL